MFSKSIVALALAGSAIANPLLERGVCGDSCAAAVTGKAALGDHGIRASHCSSFLATTVTPPAITTTVTVTGTSTTDKSGWKRTDVTYCPNTVPVYATSACSGTAAYSSACSCFGYTAESTTTIAPTTTTKTVYVVPTWESTCSSATSTVTVTATPVGATGSGYTYVAASTVTVTTTTTSTTTASPAVATGSGYLPGTVTVTTTTTAAGTCASPTGGSTSASNSTCLTDAQASSIVADFINFLENTNVGGTFDTALANQVLASDFIDQSDSINFMINTQEGAVVVPLGTTTFNGPEAFIIGQGDEQPEIPSVTTLNLVHNCDTITWRWVANFGYGNPVQGINLMYINSAGQLETDYSEFDNAAWLANYGNPQCAAQIAAASAGASNCTATATGASSPASTGSLRKRAFNPRNFHNHKRTPNNMLAHY